MAFLLAGRPDWEVELGQVAGGICSELAGLGLVGPYVRADLTGSVMLVTATAWRGSRENAAWSVARTVAYLWPDWLDEPGVGLRVWLPGWSATVGCSAMLGVAEGSIGRAAWLLGAEIVED